MDFMREISGATTLRMFRGNAYRLEPETGQFIGWHTDSDGQKQVGISINISPLPYQGGDFVLHDIETDTITKVENKIPGNAVIFRIGKRFRHQVLPVTGSQPKYAFSGWFSVAEEINSNFYT